MKLPTKLFALSIALLFLYSCHDKTHHEKEDHPKKPGYVSFTLAGTTLKNSGETTVTLFGCNTKLINSKSNWHGPKKLKWNRSNQVLSGVPFGAKHDSATNKPYYISKYYVASPPILELDKTGKINENTMYDIGVVVPDEFRFDGKGPAQNIFFDYTILKPMHVTYFDIDFGGYDDYIPFRVESNDLPWIDTDKIQNATGASGIGSLKAGTHADQLFLPYYYEEESTSYENTQKKKIILNTTVTILNDVLLHHKILFKKKNDSLVETINLTELYDPNKKKNETIQFVVQKRDSLDIPAGCRKPVAAAGPYGN